MKTFLAIMMATFCTNVLAAEPIPEITGDVTTEFGTYHPQTYDYTPAVPAYEIAQDLSSVAGPVNLIPDESKPMLASQGFVATPVSDLSAFTNISGVYQYLKDAELPVFVTTDACLHTFHILYDYVLRVIEGEYFFNDLIDFTSELIADAAEIRDTVTDPDIRMAAERNIAYLSVAMTLLDSLAVIDPAVTDLVASEIDLIDNLSLANSQVMSTGTYVFPEDYSQYKVRGHYTRTPELQRFFRAMMWYGRIAFPMEGMYLPLADARMYTRQALLLTRAIATRTINGNVPAADIWQLIYQPTVFFVGRSDDLTWESYLQVAEDVYGDDFLTRPVSVLADTTDLDTFIENALTLPKPEINPEAGTGFRLMGQRFIPDSYILDQLVNPYDPPPRFMPRGLDIMAVLGSEQAYTIIDEVYGDPDMYFWYAGKVVELQNTFAAYPAVTWAQNLYWGWLYSLLPLLDEKGEGYPLFMQSSAWLDKLLGTSLGSWAELRHDTILYAKQSYTEYTGEHPVLEVQLIRGYVEPEPDVYGRLAALAAYMIEGLENRGLLHSAFSERLDRFKALMLDLARIAVDELENRSLSDDDYALMCNFGDITGEIITFPPDLPDQYEQDTDKNLAVIADVHTDMNMEECLEVGVGNPLPIYVIAPVEGVPTLTIGAMFDYYEFKRSLADGRLSDEEWQVLLDTSEAPVPPVWTDTFRDGAYIPFERREYESNKGYVIVSVESPEPAVFSLSPVSPNPFNPSTIISYTLDEPGMVELAVYSLTGQRVKVIVAELQQPGQYRYTWQPDGLGSGCYLVVLRHQNHTAVTRAVYVK